MILAVGGFSAACPMAAPASRAAGSAPRMMRPSLPARFSIAVFILNLLDGIPRPDGYARCAVRRFPLPSETQ